jgi:hypothetical protein
VIDPHDDQQKAFERENRAQWTLAYKWPIAITAGILAVVFVVSVSDGRPFASWIGAIGLVAIIVWIFAYQRLYRSGH